MIDITKQELIEIIDDRLDKKLEEKFAEHFIKLYNLVHGEHVDFVHEMHQKSREFESHLSSLYGIYDFHVKRMEALEQEQLAANSQLDRHDGWIHTIAASTKVSLAPE